MLGEDQDPLAFLVGQKLLQALELRVQALLHGGAGAADQAFDHRDLGLDLPGRGSGDPRQEVLLRQLARLHPFFGLLLVGRGLLPDGDLAPEVPLLAFQ